MQRLLLLPVSFAHEGVVHALGLQMPPHGHGQSQDRSGNDVLVPKAAFSGSRDTADILDSYTSGLPSALVYQRFQLCRRAYG